MLGVTTAHQEVPEMLALMVRTLPSPKPANMTPPL